MDSDEERANRRLGSTVGGKWTLERLLGTGGVGAVYAARSSAGEAVAIKVLHGELAYKQDVRERFLREGVLANKVDHAGALRILEQGSTDDGSGYLVMELLCGETLSNLLRREGQLDTRRLLELLDQVLDVLVVAHDAGIIHRDLKPDNLFVTDTGQLKILDYGLARRLADIKGDFKTRTGLALGTLPYMAPEQALGRRGQMDGRVDLFALGAMAFRVLAQRRVHEAESEAELLLKMASEPAPPLSSVAPRTPPAVQQIVDLALAFNKEARYPDARTMQTDVRDVLAGRPPRFASSRLSRHNDATALGVAVSAPFTEAAQPSQRRVARTEPLPASKSGTALLPASVPDHATSAPRDVHTEAAYLAPPRSPSADAAPAVAGYAGVPSPPSGASAAAPAVGPHTLHANVDATGAPGRTSSSGRGVLVLALLLGGLALLGASVVLLLLLGERFAQPTPAGRPREAAFSPAVAPPSPTTAAPSPAGASSSVGARATPAASTSAAVEASAPHAPQPATPLEPRSPPSATAEPGPVAGSPSVRSSSAEASSTPGVSGRLPAAKPQPKRRGLSRPQE